MFSLHLVEDAQNPHVTNCSPPFHLTTAYLWLQQHPRSSSREVNKHGRPVSINQSIKSSFIWIYNFSYMKNCNKKKVQYAGPCACTHTFNHMWVVVLHPQPSSWKGPAGLDSGWLLAFCFSGRRWVSPSLSYWVSESLDSTTSISQWCWNSTRRENVNPPVYQTLSSLFIRQTDVHTTDQCCEWLSIQHRRPRTLLLPSTGCDRHNIMTQLSRNGRFCSKGTGVCGD